MIDWIMGWKGFMRIVGLTSLLFGIAGAFLWDAEGYPEHSGAYLVWVCGAFMIFMFVALDIYAHRQKMKEDDEKVVQEAERRQKEEEKMERIAEIYKAMSVAIDLPFRNTKEGSPGAKNVLTKVGFFGGDCILPKEFWEVDSSTLMARTLITVFRGIEDTQELTRFGLEMRSGVLELSTRNSLQALRVTAIAVAIDRGFANFFWF